MAADGARSTGRLEVVVVGRMLAEEVVTSGMLLVVVGRMLEEVVVGRMLLDWTVVVVVVVAMLG